MGTSGVSRAALFHAAGRPLEIISAPTPSPRGGQILARVECATLCSSDLHTQAGRRIEPTPTVLGQEIVGHVVELGPEAPRVDARGAAVTVGDRVSWSIAGSCGRCFPCTHELPQKCGQLVKYGHSRAEGDLVFSGGLADVILLAAGTTLVKIPDELDAGVAAMANCAVATVAGALRTGGLDRRKHESVLVIGAGVLGQTACAMARAAGVETVIAADVTAERARGAREFGATHFVAAGADSVIEELRAMTSGRGPCFVLELAGHLETARLALAAARTGGTVVLVGNTRPTAPLEIVPETIVRRCLHVHGLHNYAGGDLVTAIDFLLGAGARYPFKSLIAETFPLAEVDAAFARGHERPGRRVAVVP